MVTINSAFASKCVAVLLLFIVVIQLSKSSNSGPRKILLDCGANVASTVELFQTTYPDGLSFEIFSFELDDRLVPYFASYDRHHVFCPSAVMEKEAVIESFDESPWSPHKDENNHKDMQKTAGDGGRRKLSYRKKVTGIDLATWMRNNVKKEDYVIFKLDFEGAEYGILREILDENLFELVDKFYGEFHPGQPTGLMNDYKNKIKSDLKSKGIHMFDWSAETADYEDIMALNKPAVIPKIGKPGETYDKCGGKIGDRFRLAIGVSVGGTFRLAHYFIETLLKYKRVQKEKNGIDPPITLYIYAEFLDEHPEAVMRWSKDFEIASRGERPFLPGIFAQLLPNLRRRSIIHSVKIFERHGLIPTSYLAPVAGPTKLEGFSALMQGLALHVVKPTVSFPPADISELGDNYFRVHNVERAPKALRYISGSLKDKGGILVLDSDFEDSFGISVFLLDYLTDYGESNKFFELVPLSKCIE